MRTLYVNAEADLNENDVAVLFKPAAFQGL